MCCHIIPLSITSDRNAQLTSRFWSSFKKGLGNIGKLRTTFHPRTNGQEERTVQTIEYMLRACIIYFKGSWHRDLPLVEFAYDNTFHSSISMDRYKALYGRRCRFLIGWYEFSEPSLGPELIYKILEKVYIIRNWLHMAYNRQKSYTDHKKRDLGFEEGDKVYLKVSAMKVVVGVTTLKCIR